MAQLTEPKIAVFIDWHNIVSENFLDLNALLAYIHTLGRPVRQYIFLADFSDINTPEQNANYRRLVKSLENRHFTVVEKLADVVIIAENEDGEEVLKVEGNLDVELAVHVMKTLYQVPDLDQVVLFSGDADFKVVLWEIRRFRRFNPIKSLVISKRNSINMKKFAVHADQYLSLESLSIHAPRLRIAADMRQKSETPPKAQAV